MGSCKLNNVHHIGPFNILFYVNIQYIFQYYVNVRSTKVSFNLYYLMFNGYI